MVCCLRTVRYAEIAYKTYRPPHKTALPVLVYLHLHCCPADAITWVCPDQEQQDPLLPLLTMLAAHLQLELPTPQQGQLLELVPTQDGSRAVADLQVCMLGGRSLNDATVATACPVGG